MPRISVFLGIVITMYFDDHAPPHFHARYSGQEAAIGIDPLTLLAGALPARVVGQVFEWAQTTRPNCWMTGRSLRHISLRGRLRR